MSKTLDLRQSAWKSDRPGPRRRPEPLPRMRLGPFANTGLFGLRVFLGVIAVMAGYAAFHGPHG